jgi:hypothetical protein
MSITDWVKENKKEQMAVPLMRCIKILQIDAKEF